MVSLGPPMVARWKGIVQSLCSNVLAVVIVVKQWQQSSATECDLSFRATACLMEFALEA